MGDKQRVDHPLRRAFGWGGLAGTLAVFAVLLIPLTKPGHGRDARRAEGAQLGGSARDSARVQYSRAEHYQPLLVGTGAESGLPLPATIRGEFYAVVNIVSYDNADRANIYVIPASHDRPPLKFHFAWQSGVSDIVELGPYAGVNK